MSITNTQRAALLAAVEKRLKEESKAAREMADEDLMGLYEKFGGDRAQIVLGDEHIGTLQLVFDAGGYTVTDEDAFHEFLLANGMGRVRKSIRPEYMARAIELLEGECPEGVEEGVEVDRDSERLFKSIGDAFVIEGTHETVPGIAPKPKAVKGTRLSGCDPQKAMNALNGAGIGVEALLMGGDE